MYLHRNLSLGVVIARGWTFCWFLIVLASHMQCNVMFSCVLLVCMKGIVNQRVCVSQFTRFCLMFVTTTIKRFEPMIRYRQSKYLKKAKGIKPPAIEV